MFAFEGFIILYACVFVCGYKSISYIYVNLFVFHGNIFTVKKSI